MSMNSCILLPMEVSYESVDDSNMDTSLPRVKFNDIEADTKEATQPRLSPLAHM